MRKSFALFAALMVAAPALAPAAEKSNVVQVIASSPQHQTLYAAIDAAGLAGALKGEGPFTILAPTDDAFAKLPAGTVETLLKPENKAKLAAILKYHVIAGTKAEAADVVKLDGKSVKSLEGSLLPVRASGGAVMIGKAKVIKTDLDATNGVVHVIDTVLLPPDR